MSTRHLRNISIAQYEAFLELAKCKFMKNEKGHAKYTRADLNRPIIFQNHVDPVPEFIIKNALRSMCLTKKDFWDILECKSEVQRKGSKYKLVKVK